MKPEIHVYDDSAAFVAAAADRLVAAAQHAITERGRWTWVLSGGSTPRPVYEALGQTPRRDQIDWHKTYLFWGDERCVGPNDDQSNYGMAFDALIKHVPIPEGNVHRIRGELAPETAAHLYGRELRAFFDIQRNQWPIFDTVLLGLGPDGHTASLFPGCDILERHEVLVAETWVSSFKQFRISLSLNTLNAARQIIFLVRGSDKASIVHEVIEDPQAGKQYPAARIKPATPLIWLLDQAAAAELTKREATG